MSIMDHIMGWLLIGIPMLIGPIGLLCEITGLFDRDDGDTHG